MLLHSLEPKSHTRRNIPRRIGTYGYIFSETTDLQGLLSCSAHGRGIDERGCGWVFSARSRMTSPAESGCIEVIGGIASAVVFDRRGWTFGLGLRSFAALAFRTRLSIWLAMGLESPLSPSQSMNSIKQCWMTMTGHSLHTYVYDRSFVSECLWIYVNVNSRTCRVLNLCSAANDRNVKRFRWGEMSN